jgi:hypothetical protein
LLEKVFSSNESHGSKESHETDPHGVRADTAVSVDDANVFVVLVFHVPIGPDCAENDDGKDLK